MGAIRDEIEEKYWDRQREETAKNEFMIWKQILDQLRAIPDTHPRTFGVQLEALRDYAKARLFENSWVKEQ